MEGAEADVESAAVPKMPVEGLVLKNVVGGFVAFWVCTGLAGVCDWLTNSSESFFAAGAVVLGVEWRGSSYTVL